MATNADKRQRNDGVRKGLQFRETRQGVLPNSIDAFSRLTIDVATKAALTAAGAKLLVEMDAAGTRVYLADQRSGQLIGGPEDLTKLGGIRSFVSRERKESASAEVAREVTQLAYKANVEIGSEIPGYTQAPLENSYGAAVRPLLAVVRHIEDNMKKLEENQNPESREVFEPMLRNFFTKIRGCYFRLILYHTRGENTKGKLQELLFSTGVPEYVHSRLTNQGLVLDRAQELARVLFPSDPSKGLALTLKEWRDAAFRDKLGEPILANSGLVIKLVNDSNFIRSITKIDGAISLEDETNPSVARLLKTRVAVMPPMGDSRYVTEPGAKAKAGWRFPSPGMDSIQGSINALSTALMRVYSANLQSVDLVGDYYATIVPGAVSRAAVTPTNNFYVQWANADDPTSAWADRIRGGSTGTARSDIWRWLRTEMRLSEKGDGGKALALALILKENGCPGNTITRNVQGAGPPDADGNPTVVDKVVTMYPPIPPGFNTERMSRAPKVDGTANLLRPLSATEIPHWERFQRVVFPPKKRGKKKPIASGNMLTRLTPAGVELCDEVAKLSSSLAERIRSWLRGFSDERVQRAAIKLINASFDELFVAEAESSDDSESDEESDGDE